MSDLLRILDLSVAQDREAAHGLRSSATPPAQVAQTVAAIIQDVRVRGDEAVREYTARFDGAQLTDPFLPDREWDALSRACPSPVRAALELAAERVRAFHRPQIPASYEQLLPGGGKLRCLTLPLARAACYVPGGRAAYPSTVIMTVAVARLAGVPEVIVTTPPRRDGSILPEVAAAARIAGATRVLRAGGAQAVAALAIGTRGIPRADVIVGPGNAWVTEAKKQLSGEVRIDSLAGPTEVAIVADAHASPEQVAVDLIAQAEHDPLALALLVTPSRQLAEETRAALARELAARPNPVAVESLRARGAAVVTRDLDAALAFADALAPEHLQLLLEDAAAAVPKVPHAAAVFVGAFAPVPVGDYLAGPNHTLPTSGTARFASPLSASDFFRRQNVIEYGEGQLREDSAAIQVLAAAEGLHGHGRAVQFRAERDAGSAQAEVPARSGGGKASPGSFIRSTVRPLAAYGPPRDPAPVPLHLNESPHDLPPELKRKLAGQLERSDWSKYPITEGAGLAQDLAQTAGVPASSILVGNGSNELLQLLLLATLAPGDAVVLAQPSFSLYALQAKALGARVVEVPLRSPSEKGGPFRFPVAALVQAARESNAKLTLLASPNNPTGTVLSLDEAAELSRGVPGLLGIDEAYHEFCGQDFAPLLPEHPRLVLFRTFSKALAAASLRCGSLFAHPSLCAELRKVQLPYNLSASTCLVARALLAQPQLVAARVAEVIAERERISAAIGQLQARVHASGANFLLFEQEKRPAAELHAALFARGVLIRNVSSAPGLSRALRVSIGARPANDAFLAALRAELP
jgi:histidinol dehydrogenase